MAKESVDCTPDWGGLIEYMEVMLRHTKDHDGLRKMILGYFPDSDCPVTDTLSHFKKNGASHKLLNLAESTVTQKHGPDCSGKLMIRIQERMGKAILDPDSTS